MRVAILESLVEAGPAKQADLVRRLDLQYQATVRDHLNVLERLGLVVVEPSRQETGPITRHYSIVPERMSEIIAALSRLDRKR